MATTTTTKTRATKTAAKPRARKAPAKAPAKKAAKAPALVAEPSRHALAIYRFLRQEWDRLDVLPTVWCRQHGIPDPTVLRWGRGIEPDFRSLRRVADALGRSVLDVLVAGEYLTPEEANGHIPSPVMIDARKAIELDDSIDEVLTEAMLSMMDQYELIMAHAARRVESTTGGRRGARTRTRIES